MLLPFPRKIIVDAAREDSPEHNPEIDDRPPQSARERAEDRAEPRDVQQLNEERLPQRQRNIVHAVGMVDRRRLPFVRRQKPLNNLRVIKNVTIKIHLLTRSINIGRFYNSPYST